jgi:hypothetical protein
MSASACFALITDPRKISDALPPGVKYQQNALNAWHGDTFVNGPAWPEFDKAMGLDDARRAAESAYVVSVYRGAPGHRDELEK